jgi:competence protein ComEC
VCRSSAFGRAVVAAGCHYHVHFAAAGGKLFFLADYALQGLWWLLVHFAEIPLASITHAQPSYWALLFAVPGIYCCLHRRYSARWLSLVMFLPLVFTDKTTPKPATSHDPADVSAGLSAVVQTLIICWFMIPERNFPSSDAGSSVLLRFRAQGIAKIDSLISHGDNDHIGGAASLMRGTRR